MNSKKGRKGSVRERTGIEARMRRDATVSTEGQRTETRVAFIRGDGPYMM